MDIFFELTRKCNFRCSHCLRGNPQNQNMSKQVMYHGIQFFKSLEGYSPILGIGGGEPTTSVNTFEDFFYEIVSVRVTASMLWVVTNGELLSKNIGVKAQKFIDTMISFSECVCDEVFLAVSVDSFHDAQGTISSKERYWAVSDIFDTTKVQIEKMSADGGRLINMGRSYGNPVKIFIEDIEEAQFYITINGDVFPSCDLSYAFMRKFKKDFCLGNVIKNEVHVITDNWLKLKGKYGRELLLTEGGM